MIFPRLLSFAVPAFVLLTPTQAALAQYQSLDQTVENGAESGEPFAWAIQIAAGQPTLTGNVPYASIATILAERAGSDHDGMTIAEGAPLGFLRDAMKAIAASEMLVDGSIAYDEGEWSVSGTLAPDQDIAALTDVLGSSVGTGTEWVVAVETSGPNQEQAAQPADPLAQDIVESVEDLLEEHTAETGDTTENADAGAPEPEPLENETDTAPQLTAEASEPSDDAAQLQQDPEPAPADNPIVQNDASAEQPVAPADTATTNTDLSAQAAQCREQVTALTANNPISFASGRTAPTAASEGVIAEIAGILAVCPSLPVYVEGHTDADGRAETNLVLSLSRAEAVVDRLVEQGIDPQRLFAVGYGASLPVASNDTAAGKAENRRIVFSFEDIAQ
ncbi:OmpA family protein [Pelagibacterium flavum]|uniref:OmpA family protein n=1 Tax=Pelagibacterium flavum TaxID=2984530 RepID=A0ABY6IMS6_9HYPH|nr:OmpA family protein [Pelagibacterium sp. YIM 151497]UYQ70782.1 OmpA family protein [Pelagibacterium sp. YIM 151497]